MQSKFLSTWSIAAAAVLASTSGASLLGACGGEPAAFTSSSSGGDGGSSSGPGGTGSGGDDFVDNGAELFAELEPDLMTACATCHQSGGIADTPFLAGPVVYQSVLSWPGIVVRNAAESRFLTYSVTGGGHSGTNLDSAPNDLKGRVQAWLEAEAKAIGSSPTPESPQVEPVTPIEGFNVLYLTPLGEDFAGIAVSFEAKQLTPSTLELRNIQVHTTKTRGLHALHPLFVVYPKGEEADPDPMDNFAGLDAYFPENSSTELGTGIAVLTNWQDQAKLGIAFEVLEPWSSTAGEGGGAGSGGNACNDVTAFTNSARNALQTSCGNCHAGGNGQATNALDMSDLQANAAAACGQVKNRVNTTTPANSQIFVVTNPNGNASHPFKFGGNATNWNNFVNQVTTWINAE